VEMLGNDFPKALYKIGARKQDLQDGLSTVTPVKNPDIQRTATALFHPYRDYSDAQDALYRTLIANRPHRTHHEQQPPEEYQCLLRIPWDSEWFAEYIDSDMTYEIFHSIRLGNQQLVLAGRTFRDYFPASDEFGNGYTFPPAAKVQRVMQRVVDLLADRKLLVTKEGYFGLAPTLTQVGDIVVILLGCSMPVILRPHTDNAYRLVGGCYIDGMMDGEAMQKLSAGAYDILTFSIY